MDWQPIETAPKDGEPVLLYHPDERMVGPYMAAGYWGEWPGEGEGWIAVGGKPLGYFSPHMGARQGDPTHWMNLPAPPEQPRPGEDRGGYAEEGRCGQKVARPLASSADRAEALPPSYTIPPPGPR